MPARHTLAAVLAAASLAASLPAHAGPYADDMAKCLVRSTTAADRSVFLKWLFAAMALHPEVQSMAAVSPAQREEMNKAAAGLLQRLLTVSCRAESQQAVKYEGQETIQYAFQVFGQAAARELFANPRVAEGMGGLSKYVDEAKLKELLPDNGAR